MGHSKTLDHVILRTLPVVCSNLIGLRLVSVFLTCLGVLCRKDRQSSPILLSVEPPAPASKAQETPP